MSVHFHHAILDSGQWSSFSHLFPFYPHISLCFLQFHLPQLTWCHRQTHVTGTTPALSELPPLTSGAKWCAIRLFIHSKWPQGFTHDWNSLLLLVWHVVHLRVCVDHILISRAVQVWVGEPLDPSCVIWAKLWSVKGTETLQRACRILHWMIVWSGVLLLCMMSESKCMRLDTVGDWNVGFLPCACLASCPFGGLKMSIHWE